MSFFSCVSFRSSWLGFGEEEGDDDDDGAGAGAWRAEEPSELEDRDELDCLTAFGIFPWSYSL